MLRWTIVVLVGLVAFAGCVFVTPVVTELRSAVDTLAAGAQVEPLAAPMPLLGVEPSRVDSLVVSLDGVGYADLLRLEDGSWLNITPGGPRELPAGWIDTLFELLANSAATHRAVRWNERRYGPPALNVEARVRDDGDFSCGFWVGSARAQGASPHARVLVDGKPPREEVPGFRTVCFPRDPRGLDTPSYAIDAEFADRLAAHVRPHLRDPSGVFTGK